MQILVVPTNWSESARGVATSVVSARAIESGVTVLAANRGDEDQQSRYIGLSSIVSPQGVVVAQSDRGNQTLYAELLASDIVHGASRPSGLPRQELLEAYERFMPYVV